MKIYQIDAFAEKVFEGNPAAIVPLDNWLDSTLMQRIALENNLSETAFFVPKNDHFEIRWFTPSTEVDLCGHATLAAAHVLYQHLGYKGDSISFNSRSGMLTVKKTPEFLELDFPEWPIKFCEVPEDLISGLGISPEECYKCTDYLAVFKEQKQIEAIKPDFNILAKLPARGIIVTAPGEEIDFVSRFFGPASGINEDPVTGSAHSALIPYWPKNFK